MKRVNHNMVAKAQPVLCVSNCNCNANEIQIISYLMIRLELSLINKQLYTSIAVYSNSDLKDFVSVELLR